MPAPTRRNRHLSLFLPVILLHWSCGVVLVTMHQQQHHNSRAAFAFRRRLHTSRRSPAAAEGGDRHRRLLVVHPSDELSSPAAPSTSSLSTKRRRSKEGRYRWIVSSLSKITSTIGSTFSSSTTGEAVVTTTTANSSIVATTSTTSATSTPRSAFGTKEYWDDMYQGRGDFPSEEYSWYFGWDDKLKNLVAPYIRKNDKLFVPGVGNDRLLLDLVQSNYKYITAQDYSIHAIDRQRELLSHWASGGDKNSVVTLTTGDVRDLPLEWTDRYDAMIEKGLLDAVYLSGDGNVELAVSELLRTVRPGGIFVSVSGVVPDDLRRQLFGDVEWLRDGSNDLQAGCFIFRKATL